MKLLKILNINWMHKNHKYTYTQREWDRTVGWGKVPEEYKTEETDNEEVKNNEDTNYRS
jgi:hypothetical protein